MLKRFQDVFRTFSEELIERNYSILKFVLSKVILPDKIFIIVTLNQ